MNHRKKELNLFKFKHTSFYTPKDVIEKEFENNIFRNLMLVWAGVYIKAQGHLVKERTLNDYVLIYCVSGKGWLTLENKTWSISAGDIFICPPNIPHSYGADEKEPWTKFWIHYRGTGAESYRKLLQFSNKSPVKNIGNNATLISLFEDIFKVLKTGYTQSNLLCASSYLSVMLSYLNMLLINLNKSKNNSIDIQSIITFMLDNLNKTFSLDEIAEFSRISKYHLVRVFKEKTGYSPMDYYTRLKIQKACELLEVSELKIYQISSLLNFQTPYYFSQVFKRIIGTSPQIYRMNSALNGNIFS